VAYPRVPLAYVPFLAAISSERAGLPAGPNHVTVVAHHDKSVSATRYAVENDGHWNEMIAGAVGLFNQGPVDTMLVMFPTSEKGKDAGYLVEGGEPTMFLEWTYSPDEPFALRIIENDEAISVLSKAVALDTLKSLLDRIAGAPAPAGLPGLGGAPLAGPRVRFEGMKAADRPRSANQ
jgi:hypothetical protein